MPTLPAASPTLGELPNVVTNAMEIRGRLVKTTPGTGVSDRNEGLDHFAALGLNANRQVLGTYRLGVEQPDTAVRGRA
jgi:hypothetical protein